MGSAPSQESSSHLSSAQGMLFAQRRDSFQRTLSWEGKSSPRPSNLLIPWKRAVLEGLVWLLAGWMPSMALLGHEPPSALPTAAGCCLLFP